jgi:16S rRNA (cytosine967-C5)-methyltransferase
MTPSAREVVLDVLGAVEESAFASDLLRERTVGLEPREAALASEITFGVLRHQAQLDFLVGHYSSRLAARVDPALRLILRAGIYQLRYLERLPAYAVVNESVNLAKQSGRKSGAGFVNAVLRKVDRSPVEWPDRATALSMPQWLLERWDRHYGPESADRIARSFLRPPPTYVRIPARETPPQEAGRELEPTEVPGCYLLREGASPGYRLMDIGSQSIVPLLELKPGELFLDLAAAPGNKTAQALEHRVRAVACDSSFARLAGLKDLGCPLVAADATQPLPFAARFDKILADVPCSGTGTLGRNPEIKWRLRPADLKRHHRRQVRILRHALELLGPGGVLVYSTCSLEPAENEEVVNEVLGGATPAARHLRLPGRQPGDGFFAAVIRSN